MLILYTSIAVVVIVSLAIMIGKILAKPTPIK